MYKITTIRNDEDHAAAEEEITRLLTSEDAADVERLDIISDLVWVYEQGRWPIEPPTPAAAILFQMDQKNLSKKDLEPLIGPRSRVSEVLSGKRPLSITMIRRLHDALGIPLASLVGQQPTKRVPAPKRAHATKPVAKQRATGARRHPQHEAR